MFTFLQSVAESLPPPNRVAELWLTKGLPTSDSPLRSHTHNSLCVLAQTFNAYSNSAMKKNKENIIFFCFFSVLWPHPSMAYKCLISSFRVWLLLGSQKRNPSRIWRVWESNSLSKFRVSVMERKGREWMCHHLTLAEFSSHQNKWITSSSCVEHGKEWCTKTLAEFPLSNSFHICNWIKSLFNQLFLLIKSP